MSVKFTERWFGPESCSVLHRLVHEVQFMSGAIVEIGSWEGRSTVALANAAYPKTVHVIDTWQGSPGEPSAELAAERDVFAQFSENVAHLTLGNVEVHRSGWRDVDPFPAALLFVDAEHTYREVYDTIETWLPHMQPGGVICGDDIHHEPVASAVNVWFPDATVEATVWIARLP